MLLPDAMEAGIDPVGFWNMTVTEIRCAVKGYNSRVKWQATLTYMSGVLHCASLRSAFDGTPFPDIHDVFPTLFDDIPEIEQKQPWQIMQENVLKHNTYN